MQVWDTKQGKIVDIPQEQYSQLVGNSTPPTEPPSATSTMQTDTSIGVMGYTPEQQRYQDAIKRAVQAQDTKAAETLSGQFEQIYGYKLFGEAPQTAAQKQKSKDILELQKGPKKITEQGPLAGVPLLGNLGKKEAYQFFNPNTQQVESYSKYSDALSSINSELSAMGAKPLTEAEFQKVETNQPGFLQDVYNLAARPIVEGAKGYTELLGTAAGSVMLGALSAVDPNQKFTGEVQQNIAKALTPIVTQKYDKPIDTITNGVLQTLGGVGAAAQIGTIGQYGIALGTAKLIGMNLAFNAGLYGTGGAIEAAKEGVSPSEGFVSGALGRTTTGPTVALFGNTPQSQAIDTAIALIAPIFASRVMKNIKSQGLPETPPATPDQTPTELQKGIVPAIKGKLYQTATGIADPNDLVKSEKISKKILQQTESLFKRDNAIDLKNNIETAGKFIDESVAKTDKVIGPMSGNSVLSELEADLNATPEGAKNPDAVQYVLQEVGKQLNDGTPSPQGVGDFGTSLSAHNVARKFLNTQTEKWYKAGQSAVSEADKIHQLEAVASFKMKDYIAETNPAIRDALDIQATSKQFQKILSQGVKGHGFGAGLYRMYIGAIRAIIQPPITAAARHFAGEATPEVQSIISGETPQLPTVQATPMTAQEAANVSARMTAKPQLPATPPEKLADLSKGTTIAGEAPKGSTLQFRPTMQQQQAWDLVNKLPVAARTRLMKDLAALGPMTPRQQIAKTLQLLAKKRYK